MTSTWFSRFPGKIAEGARISASALFGSIFLVIFAVTAQLLAATGAISLSTTLQLTMWLVIAGLIVLLLIADMTSRAYMAGNTSGKVPAAEPQDDTEPGDGKQRSQKSTKLEAVQPKDGNLGADGDDRGKLHGALRNHSPIRVNMTDVFSHGCWLAPDSISEAQDKVTGKPVFRCRVLDQDLEHEGPLRQTVIEILADQMTDLPTLEPYQLVEFEELTVTPDDSLRAIGIKPVTPRQAPGSEPKAA